MNVLVLSSLFLFSLEDQYLKIHQALLIAGIKFFALLRLCTKRLKFKFIQVQTN